MFAWWYFAQNHRWQERASPENIEKGTHFPRYVFTYVLKEKTCALRRANIPPILLIQWFVDKPWYSIIVTCAKYQNACRRHQNQHIGALNAYYGHWGVMQGLTCVFHQRLTIPSMSYLMSTSERYASRNPFCFQLLLLQLGKQADQMAVRMVALLQVTMSLFWWVGGSVQT